MYKIEKTFDINVILMTLFTSLERIRREKNIELIYDMEKTIPRELRGDSTVLLRLLTKMLTFIFQNSDTKEVLLFLDAPEDFLYEEFMSFKIEKIHIVREKIQEFIETNLSHEIEILDGKIIYEKNADIHFELPFKINELGYRRHYRLPDVSMMHKKVLVIAESEKLAQSIKKMFSYFHYDVDVGIDAFNAQKNDMTPYDILIVEDTFHTDAFDHMIVKIQQNIPLKYVLLRGADKVAKKTVSVSTHLIKPVTKSSIYELILSVFKNETEHNKIRSQTEVNIVDLQKVLQFTKNNEKVMSPDAKREEKFQTVIESKKGMDVPVLDKAVGEANAKQMGLNYVHELQKFLDAFERTDIYFRQIVNDKSVNKIKEFSVDIVKHSKCIGAESIMKLFETINLIFVYNKLDILPIYPGKYHIELQKLIEEIKKELYQK